MDVLPVLLITAWRVSMALYNNYLTARRGISSFSLGRIAAAAPDFFLWVLVLGVREFTFGLILLIVAAVSVLLMIFVLNYKACQSPVMPCL